ncbi:hypothetical protein AAII07_58885 [Microvirga sp. 0TCS3.31]
MRIGVADGFVSQQQTWSIGNRPAQGDVLLLVAEEFAGAVIETLVLA